MRPTTRRSLVARFLALLLVFSQLCWNLPARAQETLRPAGLEESNPETKAELLSRLTGTLTGLEEGDEEEQAGVPEMAPVAAFRLGDLPMRLSRKGQDYYLSADDKIFIGAGGRLRALVAVPLWQRGVLRIGAAEGNDIRVQAAGVAPAHAAVLLNAADEVALMALGAPCAVGERILAPAFVIRTGRDRERMAFLFQRGGRFYIAGDGIQGPGNRPYVEIPFEPVPRPHPKLPNAVASARLARKVELMLLQNGAVLVVSSSLGEWMGRLIAGHALGAPSRTRARPGGRGTSPGGDRFLSTARGRGTATRLCLRPRTRAGRS